MDKRDRRVSQLMHAYWVNFAKSGDPNGPGLPAWPVYRAADDSALEIDSSPVVVRGFRGKKLDAYDAAKSWITPYADIENPVPAKILTVRLGTIQELGNERKIQAFTSLLRLPVLAAA